MARLEAPYPYVGCPASRSAELSPEFPSWRTEIAERLAHLEPSDTIRRGGVRSAASFARDPGAFTAGPGLALGDFYRLRLPGNDIHVVTRPDLVEEILVTRGDHFEKSRIYWGELRRIIGDGLGSLESDRWKVLRKLEQPFFTPRASADSLPTVQDETHGEFDDLEAWMRSQGGALTLPSLRGHPASGTP